MTKRFTETDKWEDPWFQELPQHQKLVWLYILDKCNLAGFYEVNIKRMSFDTDMSREDADTAFKALARGLEGPKDGWVWIRNFLLHQQTMPLKERNKAHIKIYRLLEKHQDRFPDVSEILLSTIPDTCPPSRGISRGRSNSEVEVEADLEPF